MQLMVYSQQLNLMRELLLFSAFFQVGKQAQRGQVTCPRTHSYRGGRVLILTQSDVELAVENTLLCCRSEVLGREVLSAERRCRECLFVVSVNKVFGFLLC